MVGAGGSRIFLLFFISMAWDSMAWDSMVLAQPGQPPAAVVTVPIVRQEVAAGQTFIGQVIPSRRSVIGSAVDGRVVEVLVNDGDRVSPVTDGDPPREMGQPLVRLLTETISIEIEAAKASAELRRYELAELTNGTRVEEKVQARARLDGAQALRDFTQLQFQRSVSLYLGSGAASEEQFEESLANAINGEKTYIAAKAAHEMAEAGPRVEQIAQAKARLAVANEEVRRLEDQRNKYTIRAPFTGHVVLKMTEVGAWLSRGDPVAEVIALDPAEIEVTVPESLIPFVKLRAATQIRVDAIPDKVFAGEVARVIPQADLRSRSFPVKIRVPNPLAEDGTHLLKSGMLAHVTLAVGPLQQALLVPKDAIVLGGPSPLVMVVRTDPQSKQPVATAVPVQLGIASGALIQVRGDLQAGQPVIVVGNERVRPGQPVVATEKSAAAGH